VLSLGILRTSRAVLGSSKRSFWVAAGGASGKKDPNVVFDVSSRVAHLVLRHQSFLHRSKTGNMRAFCLIPRLLRRSRSRMQLHVRLGGSQTEAFALTVPSIFPVLLRLRQR
jgi:hypothetical protein